MEIFSRHGGPENLRFTESVKLILLSSQIGFSLSFVFLRELKFHFEISFRGHLIRRTKETKKKYKVRIALLHQFSRLKLNMKRK